MQPKEADASHCNPTLEALDNCAKQLDSWLPDTPKNRNPSIDQERHGCPDPCPQVEGIPRLHY